MRIRLGELRGIIREVSSALDIDALKLELEKIAASRKPFLHGKWQRDHRHGGMVDYYTAQDEGSRTFTLQIDSDTVYKNDGRLRVPAKTKFFWKASIVLDPGAPWKNVTFFHASAMGEGTERPKRDAFRAKVLKIFGFDPFTWAGSLL